MKENKISHIAVIPDGNRRWARKRGLRPWMGHQLATNNLRKIFDVVLDMEIPYFSFWASSQDNLKKRPAQEVKLLLNSFKREFAKMAVNKNIHKKQVKINIIGSWREQFPQDVKDAMEKAIEATKDYNKFYFNFFIAYSGIDEMINAIKNITKKSLKDPHLKITSEVIKNNLLTKDLPLVDYLVRTGGDPHMSSGFLMWDLADSQMYFSNKLWPEFTPDDFRKAIKEYYNRQRRFGS